MTSPLKFFVECQLSVIAVEGKVLDVMDDDVRFGSQ